MFNLGKPASTGTLFGQNNSNTGFGGFNQNQNQNQNTGMGMPTNTGFGQTTNNPPTLGSTMGQSTGLFGNNNNVANSNTGGLFGANKPANTTGGLFGASTGAINTTGTTGSLFGANTTNNNTGATGGLFGANTTNNAATTGGLFGANNANTNTGTTGGLFGTNTANNSGATGSLFGNSTTTANTTGTTGGVFGAKPAGGLFGNTSNTNTMGSATTGSLFGAKPAVGTSGSLFGNNNNAGVTNPTLGTSGGLFGAKPTIGGGSLFGNSMNTNTNTGTSGSGGLFGSQQVQQQQVSALQSISQLPITPMTRILDFPPQLRQEVEQLDQYIQRQVQISQHLKADTDEHIELIGSIPRDIKFLLKTQSHTNQLLSQDLKKILSIKDLTDENIIDTQTFSTLLEQLLTPGSKISSLDLDKFFQNKIQVYQTKLDEYSKVLSDIEGAVNGINNEVTGSLDPININGEMGTSTDFTELISLKTGLNSIISTVIEEFNLFMDIAQRIAVLHQNIKEINNN